MALTAFDFTGRARPIVQVGLGSSTQPTGLARWDVARWDEPDDRFSGVEPFWRDVSCDVQQVNTEVGRSGITERFKAGRCEIIAANVTGWADPNPSPVPIPDPDALGMRPGRAVRIGIDHDVLGVIWLWRGFIDIVTPIYDPVELDLARFDCIDALGEVSRAKIVALVEPCPEETPPERFERLLDRAVWPTAKRAFSPSTTELLGSKLSGQLADLLGQTADSTSGVVFADQNGVINFRDRDWQVFLADDPNDGTIGNVRGPEGSSIPAVPGVPAHLDPAVGVIVTDDPRGDDPGQVLAVASPLAAASYYSIADDELTVGVNASSVLYGADVYSWQLSAVNRATVCMPAEEGYVLSTPGAAPLQIEGGLELVVRLQITAWDTGEVELVGRWTPPTDLSYSLMLDDGTPRLRLSYDGTTEVGATATAPVPFASGEWGWLKATYDHDALLASFATAPDSLTEPTSWTALGTDVGVT